MKLRAALLATAMMFAATALHAHDSWIVREGDGMQLVTGTRYPRSELVVPPESVITKECTSGTDPRNCWIELHPFDIVLTDKIVDVYFRDARPNDAVRERWRTLHTQGIEWHERYRKFARIEFADDKTTPDQFASMRKPANLDLEIVPLGDAPFRAGQQARFVVLSKGEPVAGQPVELVSERNPLGVWSRTDEQGRLSWPLPFSGAWLVRTVLIEADGEDAWKSRFATFLFEAGK